ncbi:MAG: hypothetical protein P9M13_00895 [Candidatus Ancaeobacter aquaticus]|nr:hypothetical protein [Candidatus Ancaeobacter aquaticus]
MKKCVISFIIALVIIASGFMSYVFANETASSSGIRKFNRSANTKHAERKRQIHKRKKFESKKKKRLIKQKRRDNLHKRKRFGF